MKPAYRRTRRFIKPRLQLRLLLAFLVIAVTAAVMLAVTIHWQVMSLIQSLPSEQQTLLIDWPQRLRFSLLVTCGLLVPVVGIGGLLITFRIAGPVYRLESFLRGVAAGETGPCRLRKEDEFQELCDLVNQALAAVEPGRASDGLPRDERRAA